MKKAAYIFILAILASCGSSVDKDLSTKDQLQLKKKEIHDLKMEVKTLETQLKQEGNLDHVQHQVPVITETVMPKKFHHYFEASGTVEAVNDALISPEINGQIKEIMVDEGQNVKKGQLLARLNADIVDNSIIEIKTALNLARTMFAKQEGLWEKKIGSEIQYLESKNTVESLEAKLATLKSQKDMAFIKSPIDGIVDDINAKVGEMASPGFMLMNVVNLNKLFINVDIAESYLPKVHLGDKVIVKFPTYPGMEIQANVFRLGNVIKKDNRTFTMQLKINNPDHKLKPNMIAVVMINDFESDTAFNVPAIVIKQDLKGAYVYLAKSENKQMVARKKYIEPGLSYNDQTLVNKGLKEGDQVIISGYNQVTDGTDILIK
jgi:membrane fusion protein, multidrug efflux system